MSTTWRPTKIKGIVYPEEDGEPLAENTLQWDWITKIKGGLDILFRDNPDVFIASDLFWYPVEGDNRTRRAPDAMVAFGRPKGHRRSYLQWLEGGIPFQVVFEILSPSNRRGNELELKFQFYETYGVEEYYIYDPDYHTLEGWLREGSSLKKIPGMNGWISPRLGTRFELVDDQFRIYDPNGNPFVSMTDYAVEAEEQRRLAEEQRRQAEEQRQRAERLAAQLRALGIEPEP
jgi:Uma2 family endonuclease